MSGRDRKISRNMKRFMDIYIYTYIYIYIYREREREREREIDEMVLHDYYVNILVIAV